MNRTNKYYQPQREAEFANKIRLALNESLEQLPSNTTERLALARKFAVSRKKNRSVFFVPAVVPAFLGKLAGGFGASSPMNSGFSWFTRMGVVLPILVLVIGLVGMYEYEEQKRVSEMAEIDELVLSDELPLSAYLDQGFSAYLNTHGE
jgi:hypothetical protein